MKNSVKELSLTM